MTATGLAARATATMINRREDLKTCLGIQVEILVFPAGFFVDILKVFLIVCHLSELSTTESLSFPVLSERLKHSFIRR